MPGLLRHWEGGKLDEKEFFIIFAVLTCLLQTVGMLLYPEDILESLAVNLGYFMRKNKCQKL
jgi:hypothetical protein